MKLRGLFASRTWLQMVESDKLPQNALVECIKSNISNDALIVNLCASKVDDAHLSLLAKSMHHHLSRVDLNFCMCSRLTGKGVEDLSRHMPAKLKTLKLNFKPLGRTWALRNQREWNRCRASVPSALGIAHTSVCHKSVKGKSGLGVASDLCVKKMPNKSNLQPVSKNILKNHEMASCAPLL